MNSEYSAQVIAFPINAARKLQTRQQSDQQNRQEKDRTLTGEAFFSVLRANVDQAEKILEKTSVFQEDEKSEDRWSQPGTCIDICNLSTDHDLHLESTYSSSGFVARDLSGHLENGDCNIQSSGRTMKLPGKFLEQDSNGNSSFALYDMALAEKDISSSDVQSDRLDALSLFAGENAVDRPLQVTVEGDNVHQNRLAGVLLSKQEVEAEKDIAVGKAAKLTSQQECFRHETVSEKGDNRTAEPSKSDGKTDETKQKQGVIITNQSIDVSNNPAPSGARTSTDQIVDNIRAAQFNNPPASLVNLSSGRRVVRFTLQPENLGSLEISLSMRGSELAVRITVDQLETRREISKSKDTLLEALSDAGLSVNSVEIVDVSPSVEKESGLQPEVGAGLGDEKAQLQSDNQFSEQKYRQRRLNNEQAVENRSEGSIYEGDDAENRSLGSRRVGYFL